MPRAGLLICVSPARPSPEAELKKITKQADGADKVAAIAKARASREWRNKPRAGKEVQAAREAVKPAFRFLTRTDLVAILGCSYPTILDAIRRGVLPRPHKFLGRTVWFSNEVYDVINALPLQEPQGHRDTGAGVMH